MDADSDIPLSQRRWYGICDLIFQGLPANSIRAQIEARFPGSKPSVQPVAGSGTSVLLDCLAHRQHDFLSNVASKICFGRPVYDTDEKRKKLADNALRAAKDENRIREGGRPPSGTEQVCRVCCLAWNDERAIGTRKQNIHQKNQWSHTNSHFYYFTH